MLGVLALLEKIMGGEKMDIVEIVKLNLEDLKKTYGVLSSYVWDFDEGVEGVKVMSYDMEKRIIRAVGSQTEKPMILYFTWDRSGDIIIEQFEYEGEEDEEAEL